MAGQGELLETEGGYVLRYWEQEGSGLEGTETALEIQPGQIVLTRTGAVRSQMVFRKGHRHLSSYETPYGEMSLAVHTRRMEIALDSQGGEIQLEYAIEMGGQLAGVNLFRIKLWETEGEQEREGES